MSVDFTLDAAVVVSGCWLSEYSIFAAGKANLSASSFPEMPECAATCSHLMLILLDLMILVNFVHFLYF